MIELGIDVFGDDYRFLRAYDLLSVDGVIANGVTEVPVVEEIGGPFADDQLIYPGDYVNDLNGDRIKNCIIGPSSYSNDTDGDSRGIIQNRPGYVAAENDAITIDEDTGGNADILRMWLADKDNAIIVTTPVDWSVFNTYINSRFSLNTPKMAGISGHANSFIFNITSDDVYTLKSPMTAKSSIDYRYSYRYSMYYRSTGSVVITPKVEYYTNAGSLISTVTYDTFILANTDTGDSDFTFYQISIPRIGEGESIPESAKRLQIVFEITTDSTGVLEIIYPVLEHAIELSSTSGYIYLPEPPSLFSFDEIFAGKLDIMPTGKIISFNSTQLFYSHIGRKLFTVSMEFDMMPVSLLYQLRELEQMSLMGYMINFRPNHPDLPAIMKGAIKIENSNITYDYEHNRVSINFEEML